MTIEMINVSVDLDVYKAIESKRISFTQSQNDILKQHFGLSLRNPTTVPHVQLVTDIPAHQARKRVTGNYGFILLGQSYSYEGLKEAYLECLKLLSNRDKDFLKALSNFQTHARRIVSDVPSGLFLKSPHLAEKSAERLDDKWWVDVNLSQQQVEARLLQACKTAKLKFGYDLKLEFPTE